LRVKEEVEVFHDYNVLKAFIGDDGWVEVLSTAFQEGSFNGLLLKARKGLTVDDLDGLQNLRGLEYLNVTGPVKDDTVAFEIGSLRELALLTRCKVPVPRVVAAQKLDSVGIDDRPGKDAVASLPNLKSLFVWSWRAPDLNELSAAHGVTRLHLEGHGQVVSLDGIGQCTALEDVHLDVMQAESLAPLATLARLKKLWIINDPRKQSDVVLDLNAIAHLPSLQELRLSFGGAIQSLSPVRRMAALRDIRIGARICDGDLSPLTNLGPDVTVVGPDE
jgi:hypothetical protein